MSAGEQLTLLHIADCHLGSRPSGTEEQAFAALIDFAVALEPDVLVIAGDLFDSARVPAAVVAWAAAQLDRVPCDAVVLPGNHDALLPGSPYTVHRFAERARAVKVIAEPRGEVVLAAGGRVAVWGRPVIDHAPSFRPLDGAPGRPPPGCIGIIAAHGLFVDHDGEEAIRGSPIYRSQLEGIAWDYVALGHWPRYRELQREPPAIYAGELTHGSRHVGSAVVVTFADGRAHPRRLSTGDSGEWTSRAAFSVTGDAVQS